MDWDDLRFFLDVSRTKSLTKTASKLNVSQSTVSRKISKLEQSLSTCLFVHHQTGYFLTDAGNEVFKYAEEVEEKVGYLEKKVSGRDLKPSGTVRLATAVTLANYLIIPALPRFMARYPDIKIELITGIDTVSVIRNDADIALRLVRPKQNSVKIRKIGVLESALFCSESYMLEHRITLESDLENYKFITWDKSLSHLPSAKWLRENFPRIDSILASTNLLVQIAAVKSGLGLAVLPKFIAREDNDLVEVFSAKNSLSEDLWLVSHTELITSSRINAVSEFLIELMTEAQMRSSPMIV